MSILNVQTQFNPDKEKTVAELADKIGIKIKLPCDGKGKCGKCLVKISEGDMNPPTIEEEKMIKASDLEAGYRLACCAVPKGDFTISLEGKSKK